MSRHMKWKLEKTKVKVVFRLQFHATHIPQTGWDKLFISFIPLDSGKAIAKTTKANVRNGICKWGDPIYETTRLLQDAKTKQYDDKLYKLVLMMGTSRSSTLGEAIINLADYVEASKPSTVALPLHGCDSAATLNVTVQLLTSKTGFREFEQQREISEKGVQRAATQNSHDSIIGKVPSSEETVNDHMDKVHARVRFKPHPKEHASGEEFGIHEYADSAVGCDVSSSTSESLHAEKNDFSSSHEVDSLINNVSGDQGGHSHSQSLRLLKGDSADPQLLRHGSSDWVHGWSSDYSLDNESVIANEENSRLRGSLEAAESCIYQTKSEVILLQTLANGLCSDTQKFADQLASEFATGQDLRKEVLVLKSESIQLKNDLERLKAAKFNSLREITKVSDQDQIIQNLKFRWEDGLLFIENKVRELQNKTSIGLQESNFSFLCPDLEMLLSAIYDLRKANGLGEPGVSGTVSRELNNVDVTNALRDKVIELLRELDDTKAEGEILTRKMDQMECYYEALIHELEENQKLMLTELHNIRNEHSTCAYTISATKVQMETMHQDLSEQIARYAADRRELDELNKELESRATSSEAAFKSEMEAMRQSFSEQIAQCTEDRRELDELNRELEKRVISSEAALKMARLNYTIAVDQLQKDLEILSLQIIAMHQTNESLIKQAFPNPPPPGGLSDPEAPQNSTPYNGVKHLQRYYKNRGGQKEQAGSEMILEELKRSLRVQEDLYQVVEVEVCEMLLANVELDIFATALQETLREGNGSFLCMNNAIDRLAHQLFLATKSRDLLMRRLQNAEEDVQTLNDVKDSYISKCDKMEIQNRDLMARLESMDCDNYNLCQKIKESESMVMEFGVYKEKYEACNAERINLEVLLHKECVEKESLLSDVSEIQGKVRSVESECLELASLKIDMSEKINFLQDRLRKMLQAHGGNLHDRSLPLPAEHYDKELDTLDCQTIVARLESSQHDASEKLLKLMEENQNLKIERETIAASLERRNSEAVGLKEKLKSDFLDLFNDIKKSELSVQKLQLEVKAIAERTKLISELEAISAQFGHEFSQSLSHLENQLQAIASNNNDIVSEILALKNVSEELDKSRRVISELEKEKQLISRCFQDSTDQSVELKAELHKLQENVIALQEELNMERAHSDNLRGQVTVFSYNLNDKSSQVVHLEQRLQELEIIAERVANVSELDGKLSQLKDEFSSGFSDLEAQLEDLKSENRVLEVKILALQTTNEDLSSSQLTVSELRQKNEALEKSLQERSDLIMKQGAETAKLRETMDGLDHELKCEKSFRDILESRVTELALESETCVTSSQKSKEKCAELEAQISILAKQLEDLEHELYCVRNLKEKTESRAALLTCQLNETRKQLQDSEQQKLELAQCNQRVLDLESEKSRLTRLLQGHEEHLFSCEKSSSISDLENDEMHKLLLAEEVKLTFVETHYKNSFHELLQRLNLSDRHLDNLQKKCVDLDTELKNCLDREASYIKDHATLTKYLESLRSELEASGAHNSILVESQSAIATELNQYKEKVASLELCSLKEKDQHTRNIEELNSALQSSRKTIDSLFLSSEASSIEVMVLKAKLNTVLTHITSLGSYKDEVIMLKTQCTELTQRLYEEVSKAEEFRNLSVHFKELKDKAEAQCTRASEKNEPEGSTMARQDSLRVAFIKEQCETQIQDLRQQLSISKRHGEEMLWKFQDAINETESRKKSEASFIKKIDELSERVFQLETDLEKAISDKREKAMEIDRMQAELDCSLISLECCKEEKQKIEESLLQCQLELEKTESELTSARDELKSLRKQYNLLKEYENTSLENDAVVTNGSHVKETAPTYPQNGLKDDLQPRCLDQDVDFNTLPPLADQDVVLDIGVKNLDFTSQQLHTKSLRSSMENLHNELEKMKRENSDMQDSIIFEPNSSDLRKEIMLLDKANEELGSRYPLYNEFSGNGNALERVLALELELAEQLQAKKKPAFNLQSSFLKMHGDEEAIFKSFRDINELIKETLDIKGRYSSVETELKDMHERYSELSLQFAEVEGERQKLMMTLKNARASRRNSLGWTGSATLAEFSP